MIGTVDGGYSVTTAVLLDGTGLGRWYGLWRRGDEDLLSWRRRGGGVFF